MIEIVVVTSTITSVGSLYSKVDVKIYILQFQIVRIKSANINSYKAFLCLAII